MLGHPQGAEGNVPNEGCNMAGEQPEIDVEDTEEDLKRIAASRQVRRILFFLSAAFGAALFARFSAEAFTSVESFRGILPEEINPPRALLVEYIVGSGAVLLLLHLAYAWTLMILQWRVFKPFLESKQAEGVAVGLINLTTIFGKAQRLSQSRSVAGAAIISFGLVRVLDGHTYVADPGQGYPVLTIALLLIAIGGVILVASFLLRYGFPFSRVVLVPLLEAVVGAESSTESDEAVRKKVTEIMKRFRAQRPWWFYGPGWIY